MQKNRIESAGILFPGTAWFGLSAVIVGPGLVPSGRRWVWVAFLVACAFSQSFSKPTPPPREWATVQTSFAPGRGLDGANELTASDILQRIVHESRAKVTVAPETVVRRWTVATEAFWEPTLASLAKQHRLAIIGVGLPIFDSAAYENAALVVGSEKPHAFLQRIPVPVGMWRPFAVGPSVPLRLRSAGTIDIADQRVAVLICYEQLLVLPVLLSEIEHPTLIVGMANQYWVRETSIPAAQRASLMAWSRLFGLPLLISENR